MWRNPAASSSKVRTVGNTRLRTGGPDTKWTLSADGIYRITIDQFNETVKAELVK